MVLLVFAVEAFGNEAVADPGLGLNELLAGFGLELLAKLADKDAEILRLVCRLRAPDGGEQGAMRHDLAGVAREVEQKIEFLGRQVNGLACDLDAVGGGVDDKVAGLDGGSVRSGARRRWARTRASSS